MRIIVLLGLLAGLAFAGGDTPLPIDQPRPPQPNVPIVRACEEIEADARTLLAEAQACTKADACEVVSFEQLVGPDSCVAAFQCAGALSAEADQEEFVAVARLLADEKRACGECSEAACRPPEELRAECVDGRCVLTLRPPVPDRPLPRGL